MRIITPSFNRGIKPYTKLLIHPTGATIRDEMGKAVTANGGAALATGGKFGLPYVSCRSSTNAYLSLADSVDWYFGTGDFTIRFWYKPVTYVSGQGLIGQRVDDDNLWYFYLGSTSYLRFISGGVHKADYSFAPGLSAGNWYHFQVGRKGTGAFAFVNGQDKGISATVAFGSNDVGEIAGLLTIGVAASTYADGYFQDVEILKGIGITGANFTAPTRRR
jgi:hypothetical protein